HDRGATAFLSRSARATSPGEFLLPRREAHKAQAGDVGLLPGVVKQVEGVGSSGWGVARNEHGGAADTSAARPGCVVAPACRLELPPPARVGVPRTHARNLMQRRYVARPDIVRERKRDELVRAAAGGVDAALDAGPWAFAAQIGRERGDNLPRQLDTRAAGANSLTRERAHRRFQADRHNHEPGTLEQELTSELSARVLPQELPFLHRGTDGH